MPERPKKLWKEAALQIASGGSAGFIEVCLMHPLDLVKTRLQLQCHVAHTAPGVAGVNGVAGVSDPAVYRGVFDCLRKMYHTEGLLSFWKGVLPPIVAETPKRAIKFFTFEQYKKLFYFGAESPTPLTFSCAGLCAGVTEAVVVNPFEVVKVKLQANRAHSKESPSTWTITKDIVHREGLGLQGLNKGVTATMARNGVFNMMYFGFYHSMKGIIPEYTDPMAEFARKVALGFTAGTLASCLNIPFDVAKSRIQGPQPVAGQIKYRSTLSSLLLVYREEGWRALYKGLVPKVMRLGPGGAIMLIAYDYVHHFLSISFPD